MSLSNRPALRKEFLSRIPDGLVPEEVLYQKRRITKLRPFKTLYFFSEWCVTSKKRKSWGSLYYAVTKRDDLLCVRDQDLERRDLGHVPQESFGSNMLLQIVLETLRIGVPL